MPFIYWLKKKKGNRNHIYFCRHFKISLKFYAKTLMETQLMLTSGCNICCCSHSAVALSYNTISFQKHKMPWEIEYNCHLAFTVKPLFMLGIKSLKHVLLSFSLTTTWCCDLLKPFEALLRAARGNLPDCLFS